MPMRMGTPIPALEGAVEWVNGQVRAEDLRGTPTIVHFWSISCGSCHEIMEHVKTWKQRYGEQGVRFVGIHMPRSERDTDAQAVKDDIAEMQIDWPQAIDSRHAIVNAFDNKYVPAFYLFNEEGVLRHFQAGDRGQKMLEAAVDRVLRQRDAAQTAGAAQS